MKLNRVLVLDDEDMIRTLMRKILERKGFEVIEAKSSEEVLDILKNDTFHIFYFDLMLPGMNGIELCKLIKKNNPVAIIYAITGYTSVFELTTCRDAGFDDYFKKPLKIDEIYKAAEDAVEKLKRWTTKN
ncbi:MAG: response regulator [Candidatus Cloacimonetes bacterium]|jgi:DNA-binding response OmpR family regulator|nr:response regulator [Candidatus Cloacimonadota bacterium]